MINLISRFRGTRLRRDRGSKKKESPVSPRLVCLLLFFFSPSLTFFLHPSSITLPSTFHLPFIHILQHPSLHISIYPEATGYAPFISISICLLHSVPRTGPTRAPGAGALRLQGLSRRPKGDTRCSARVQRELDCSFPKTIPNVPCSLPYTLETL